MNFNTSNVKVQRLCKIINRTLNYHFNTSNVKVQPYKSMHCELAAMISIHLMLRFNGGIYARDKQIGGISIHLMLRFN